MLGSRATRSVARSLVLPLVVVALGLTGRSGVAEAQTASEIATARQWFADGLSREEKGEYAPALELFRRAAQVKKTPQIVYHVGFCESRTGALVEAVVDLGNAVVLAHSAQMENVVAAAQAELADVNKRIPTLDVRVRGDASAARFVVDGSTIALSMLHAPMPLDPGEHTITIELASGASATKKETLFEHDAKVLELAPSSASAIAATPVPTPAATIPAEPPASAASVAAEPQEPSGARSSSVLPWTLVGVGGALVVGGGALFAVARGKQSTLDQSCPSHVACDPSLQSTYDAAKTFNTVGLTLGAVGIVAAGVGVSLLIARPSSTTSAALVVSPRGAALTMRF